MKNNTKRTALPSNTRHAWKLQRRGADGITETHQARHIGTRAQAEEWALGFPGWRLSCV